MDRLARGDPAGNSGQGHPRLTAHTTQRMEWGAELGLTTLTANRSSVEAILRELKGARVEGHWEVMTGVIS